MENHHRRYGFVLKCNFNWFFSERLFICSKLRYYIEVNLSEYENSVFKTILINTTTKLTHSVFISSHPRESLVGQNYHSFMNTASQTDVFLEDKELMCRCRKTSFGYL